jgi:CRP-like cAMP-binding protein
MNEKADIKRLIAACTQSGTEMALGQNFKPSDWELLGPYLQPAVLSQGQVLINQGGSDRNVYFVESGSLSVHYKDRTGKVRLGVVNAGSAVGEGSFFSRLPRKATVQAASASIVWTLTPLRFSEMSNRQPAVAVEVAMALGALVALRLVDKRKRVSIT